MCRFALEDYSTAYPELEHALSLSRDEIYTLSDHRQIAEILNNLGCLSYMGGEIERAMLYFRESIKVQTIASEHSMYVGSKFSCHAASLNMSITTANIGFLSMTFYRDAAESVAIFESAVKVSIASERVYNARSVCLNPRERFVACFFVDQDQQVLLRDAHTTLITTMQHLAVANLLAGSKIKALHLLQRVFHMQVDAFGPDDKQCQLTRTKISMLEDDESTQQADYLGKSTILPILETSHESSCDSPNTSMFSTLKVWREKNTIKDAYFL